MLYLEFTIYMSVGDFAVTHKKIQVATAEIFKGDIRLGPISKWLDFGSDLDQHQNPGQHWSIPYHYQVGQTSAK